MNLIMTIDFELQQQQYLTVQQSKTDIFYELMKIESALWTENDQKWSFEDVSCYIINKWTEYFKSIYVKSMTLY